MAAEAQEDRRLAEAGEETSGAATQWPAQTGHRVPPHRVVVHRCTRVVLGHLTICPVEVADQALGVVPARELAEVGGTCGLQFTGLVASLEARQKGLLLSHRRPAGRPSGRAAERPFTSNSTSSASE